MHLPKKYGITDSGTDVESCYIIALIYNVIHDEIDEYLSEFSLSVGQFNLLIALKRHQGQPIKQVEISQYLIVSPSNMTKLIDKLEKNGLVKRTAQAADRRANLIAITPSGLSLVDAAWPGYQALMSEKMSSLTKEDRRALASILPRWLSALDKSS
jgi:DNA-binding MarR family transcriptional regulator